MLRALSKPDRARLITYPSLLAFGLLFLLIVVAMTLMTAWLRQGLFIRPVSPEVRVVHITGNAAERHHVSVSAFRDNTVWKTDEMVGLLSVAAACRASVRSKVLPDELSINRVLSVVGTEAFQQVGNAADTKFDVWLVRVGDGLQHKCYSLSDADAAKNPDFAALTQWFQAVEAMPDPLRAVDCLEDPDSVYKWCK